MYKNVTASAPSCQIQPCLGLASTQQTPTIALLVNSYATLKIPPRSAIVHDKG